MVPALDHRTYRLIFEQYAVTGAKRKFAAQTLVVGNTTVDQFPMRPRIVTGLRVVFDITKSSAKQPNPGTIEVHNLSRESRAYIEEKNTLVTLVAGHYGLERQIFTGDIAKVSTKREAGNIVTMLECGDGEFLYGQQTVNVSFKPGTTAGPALDFVIEKFGYTKGQIKGFDRNQVYNQGLSLSGLARQALDIITGRQTLDWSVQDNQLQILPEGTALDGDVIVLTPSTGLIGIPTRIRILRQDIAKRVDGRAPESGVSATSLLNGDLRPGKLFRIESEFVGENPLSRDANGSYVVRKVRHHGDTHGNDWYSEVEGQ